MVKVVASIYSSATNLQNTIDVESEAHSVVRLLYSRRMDIGDTQMVHTHARSL